MIRQTYTLGERFVALALAIGVAVSPAAMIVPAEMAAYVAADREIEGLRARYSELVRRQRDLGMLEARRDDLKATDPQRYGLLVADTVDVARAEVQNALKEFATASEATIAQFRAIESEDPRLVSAQVNLRVPMAALPDLLTRIATSEPPLFVDALDIGLTRRSRRDPDAEDILVVDLVLSSFVLVPGRGTGQ